MRAHARLLARIVGQRERASGVSSVLESVARLMLLSGREGGLEIAAEGLVRAQRRLEAVDDERHLRRQAAGLRLAQLRARTAFVAHGGKHLRQLEPHARGLRLLVEDRAECQRRIGVALLAGIHHAEAKAGLRASLDCRVRRDRLVDRLGVGIVPGQMRLIGQVEELRGGEARKRAPVVRKSGRLLRRGHRRRVRARPGLAGLRARPRRNGGKQHGNEEGHAQRHRLSYANGSGCTMLLALFPAGWMYPT